MFKPTEYKITRTRTLERVAQDAPVFDAIGKILLGIKTTREVIALSPSAWDALLVSADWSEAVATWRTLSSAKRLESQARKDASEEAVLIKHAKLFKTLAQ